MTEVSIKGFKEVSKKEMESVDGGAWWFVALCIVGFICGIASGIAEAA